MFEPTTAYRVVAAPIALDLFLDERSKSNAPGYVCRVAPDEVLLVVEPMASAYRTEQVLIDRGELGDEHAIVEPEDGLVAAWLTWREFDATVAPHIEWPLPGARPRAALGLVAAVPCQLWLTDERVLLTTYAAYADELTQRLS